MGLGIIDGYNFGEMNAMKYYAPPASWDDRKKKETVHSRIFSGDWYSAEKKDGFFGKFVKDDDGAMLLYSRSRSVTGEYVNKIEWVPQLQSFFDSLPNGTCLLGELYLPKQPGSKCVQTILGCLKDKAIARQEQGEKINFYIFDLLALNGHSHLNDGYKNRTDLIKTLPSNNEYVQFAQYYNGAELWEKLQEILASGGEGMVLVHQSAPYEPDKRPSKTTLKVKQELKQTIDCVVIGANIPTKEYNGKNIEEWKYWVDDRTNERCPLEGNHYKDYVLGGTIVPVTKNYYYHWAGSFRLGLYNEKTRQYDYYGDLSGLTEEMLSNPKYYVGKVAEVGGMMIDKESKHIRHPRLMGFRDDKAPTECTIDQLEEI